MGRKVVTSGRSLGIRSTNGKIGGTILPFASANTSGQGADFTTSSYTY